MCVIVCFPHLTLATIRRAVELEKNITRHKVQNDLNSRPTKDALLAQGLILDKNPNAAELEKNIIKHKVENDLNSRPTKNNLIDKGVILNKNPNAAALEKNINKHKVENDLNSRPSKSDLIDQGVYVDKTPNQQAIEVGAKASLLKQGLTAVNRPGIDDLKSKGIHKTAAQSGGVALEKSMAEDTLNKHLQKPRTNSNA